MAYYNLEDFTVEFARKKGSKDKQPRKKVLGNIAKVAGGVVLAGGLGYLALKNKNKLFPINKKLSNSKKVKQRLNLIKNEMIDKKYVTDKKVLPRVGIKPTEGKDKFDRLTDNIDQRSSVRRAVKNLKEKNAYLSMPTVFLADFARKKGSKDKAKRKGRSAIGRVIGAGVGAAGGGALTAAGVGIAGMYLAKKASINPGQVANALGDLKSASRLQKLKKHRKAIVLGGAALGATAGATADTEQLQEGRRLVSTANRTSQELRGYISMSKRYGLT